MSVSDHLRNKSVACETRIGELAARIKDLQDAKESLALYKTDVSGSEGTFRSAIEDRKLLLADLSNIANCNSAEMYQKGMENTLSGIGSGLVLLVFDWMKIHIGLKDLWYDAQIELAEAEISLKRAELDALQTEISIAESLSL